MRSLSGHSWTIVRPALILSSLALQITGLTSARAQGWPGYAGGPQHSGVSPVASQFPQAILWSTPVDLNPQNQFGVLNVHYGSPLVTPKNTVIVPVKTGAFQGFRIEAHRGSDGTLIWQLDSDYPLPPFFDWILPFQSVLTGGLVAMAGNGGTIILRSSPDRASGNVTRLAFYGIANYNANPDAYNASVQIITPITRDSSGNLFFGFLAE